MNKCQAALKTLIDRNTSEFWMFWATLALSAASFMIPGFQDRASTLTQGILGIDFSTLIGGWMGVYVIPRMVSKGVKA